MFEELFQDVTEVDFEDFQAWRRPPTYSFGFKKYMFKLNGLYKQISLVLGFPFQLLQRVTIPIVAEERYSFTALAVSLLFAPMFLLFYFTVPGRFYWIAFLAGVFQGLIALLSLQAQDMVQIPAILIQLGKVYVFALGFATSAFWIDLLATELVGSIVMWGNVIGLSQSFLGMTLLALGNSIGDYIQDIAAAKNNRANMAITACFGGPLLNLLFGTGLGFLLLLLRKAKQSGILEVFVEVRIDALLYLPLLFVLLNCASIIIAAMIFKQRLPQSFAKFQYTLYALFTLLMASYELSFWIKRNHI